MTNQPKASPLTEDAVVMIAYDAAVGAIDGMISPSMAAENLLPLSSEHKEIIASAMALTCSVVSGFFNKIRSEGADVSVLNDMTGDKFNAMAKRVLGAPNKEINFNP